MEYGIEYRRLILCSLSWHHTIRFPWDFLLINLETDSNDQENVKAKSWLDVSLQLSFSFRQKSLPKVENKNTFVGNMELEN